MYTLAPRKTRRTPPLQANYIIEPLDRSYWSVITPVDAFNRIPNPHFSAATYSTGYGVGAGGTLSASTDVYLGTAAAQVAFSGSSNRYFRYASLTRTSGGSATASIYVKCTSGGTAKLYLALMNTGLTLSIAGPTVRVGPNWTRLTVTADGGSIDTLGTTISVVLNDDTDAGANKTVIVGHVQYEETRYFTTPIAGDYEGCMWLGGAHESISYRPDTTRKGGRIVNFRDYRFAMTALVGAAALAYNTVDTDFAFGGGYYQRSTPQTTNFTIAGVFESNSFVELKTLHRAMLDAIKPDALNQPIRLLYQPTGCAENIGQALDIEAVYTGGLEGNQTSEYSEVVSLTFRVYTPFVARELNQSYTALTMAESVSVEKRVVTRDRNGDYSSFAASTVPVQNLVLGPDGSIYGQMLGDGVSTFSTTVVKWSGTAWTTIGTLAPVPTVGSTYGFVNKFLFAPNGNLVVLGEFASISGVVGKGVLAYTTAGTWATYGAGLTNGAGLGVMATDGAYDRDGSLVVVGAYNAWNGTSAQTAAKLTTAGAIVAMNTGLAANDQVLAVEATKAGYLYGSVFNAGASTVSKTKYWNGLTWSDVGTLAGPVHDMKMLADGNLVVVGQFAGVSGGVQSNSAIIFNGTSWISMRGGLTPISGNVDGSRIFVDEIGNVHISGLFAGAGNVSAANWIVWNGSTWLPPDGDIPQGTTYGVLESLVGTPLDRYMSIIGIPTSAVTSVAFTAITVVTNNGSAPAVPTFTFTGPGELKVLKNNTTKQAAYFNLTLSAGEIATLTLGAIPTFTSNFRGDLTSFILPGSSLSEWTLRVGTNQIALFIRNTSGSSGAGVNWRETYDTLDAGALP